MLSWESSVLPYASLDPLKALLPIKIGESEILIDAQGVGGIHTVGLSRRMRERWRLVSRLWEENKTSSNNKNLLRQLDYFGKLSVQLEWQHNHGNRPVRVAYTSAGQPTAALLHDDVALVENVLFWITCKHFREANYLLAVINSNALYEAVAPLMPKGQYGARHLHKHLWRLPIPEYDAAHELHVEVSEAGEAAAWGAAKQLAQLRQERDRVTDTIARRELRTWLRASPEGKAVEAAVVRLLGG